MNGARKKRLMSKRCYKCSQSWKSFTALTNSECLDHRYHHRRMRKVQSHRCCRHIECLQGWLQMVGALFQADAFRNRETIYLRLCENNIELCVVLLDMCNTSRGHLSYCTEHTCGNRTSSYVQNGNEAERCLHFHLRRTLQ